jgi:hypothetical protein
MLSLLGWLALAVGTSAAIFHNDDARSLAPRVNLNPSIDTFVKSLSLRGEKTTSLLTYLAKDENLVAYLSNKSYDNSGLATTACKTLEIVLGTESVDTTPVNQSILEESW